MDLNQPPVVGKKRTNWVLWILLGVMVVVGLPIIACAGIAWIGYGAITAPVNAAVAALNENPGITAKLGSPITNGSGIGISNYNNDNGNGSADISLNVSGPNGAATVEGTMSLNAGVWRPKQLMVICDDGTAFQVETEVVETMQFDPEAESTEIEAADADGAAELETAQ